MFFFYSSPGNSTAQTVLWMVGAEGGQYAGKVLVGQDERAESPPLLDHGGLLAKGRGQESREDREARMYVCIFPREATELLSWACAWESSSSLAHVSDQRPESPRVGG